MRKRSSFWLVLGFMLALTLGLTVPYNFRVQLVDSTGTVLSGGVESATAGNPLYTVQVVDANNLVLNSLGAVGLTQIGNGSVSNTAPMWARWYGDGADGAGPASGAWGVSTLEKHFTSWTCTGVITVSNNTSIIVRSQGPVNLNTGCQLITSGSNGGSTVGDLGGAGGSGGAGAANSAASISTTWTNPVGGNPQAAAILSFQAAASAAGAGNDGGVISQSWYENVQSIGYGFRPRGGGIGTQGGSTGGAAGQGGGDIIIIAPSVNIAAGVVLDSSGGRGVAAAAVSTGGGGGGGAGFIWILTGAFTDNGAIYKYGGGAGGQNQIPNIQVGSDGCDTTGCGIDGLVTITALVGGGLSAGSITISNAGSGYKTAPSCIINAGASGLTGSPACHFTISGGAINSIVIDTAGSGGTLTNFTTSFDGGFGANGKYWQTTIQ